MIEPQKEYIITEEQLERLWVSFDNCEVDEILGTVRSRPYNVPTSAEQLITELSDFVHQNAEMVQNKLEDNWGTFDMMVTAIRKELRAQRGREP